MYNEKLKLALASVFVFCLTMMVALPNYAQNDSVKGPQFDGLLWKVSGNGHTSYLFVADMNFDSYQHIFSKKMLKVFSKCDALVMEMNPEQEFRTFDQSKWLAMMEAVATYGSYSDIGDGNLYKNLFAMETDMRAYIFASLSGNAIYRVPNAQGPLGNIVRGENVFNSFYRVAKRNNMKIDGLTNMDEINRVTYRSLEEMIKELEQRISKSDEFDSELHWKEHADAYLTGDLNKLDSLNRNLYDRNHRISFINMNKEIHLKNLENKVGSTNAFVILQPSDMVGHDGAIMMLRSKGYDVEKVKYGVGSAPNPKMDKLIKSFTSPKLNDYSTGNGLFSVALPSPFISHPYMTAPGENFTFDFENCGVFAMNRYTTSGPAMGHFSEAMLVKIDSFFYEYAPGEVLSKELVETNGFPTYEVVYKNSSEDIFALKLIITPMEYIAFRVGGLKDYVEKAKIARPFFKSIKMNNDVLNGEWSGFNPSHGEYEVMLPSYRLVDTMAREQSENILRTFYVQGYDVSDTGWFSVIRNVYPDHIYLEEDTFELNYTVDMFAENLNIDVDTIFPLTDSKYPGVQFKLSSEEKDYNLCGRVYIRGHHYYILLANSNNREKKEKFFNSFKLLPFKHDAKPAIVVDTTHFYSAESYSPINQSPAEALFEKYNKVTSYSFRYGDKDEEEEDKSFESVYEIVSYNHPLTAEEVIIAYKKYHQYDHVEHLDTLYKNILEYDSGDSTYIISDYKKEMVDGLSTVSYQLTDTATTRYIRKKYIMKQGVLYEISFNGDLITGESEFANSIFNTFQPSHDTAIGLCPLKDKSMLILQHAWSGDTILQKRAFSNHFFFSPEDEHTDSIIEFLKSPVAAKIPLKDRAAYIEDLGSLEHDSIIPFLEDVYMESGDTMTIKLAVLQALAYQKSVPAADKFLDLLEYDTPLSSSSWETRSIVTSWSDSLEVAVNLFPEILDYTRYEEYESAIYQLLAMLSDSNLVNQSHYGESLERLLSLAKDEKERYVLSLDGYDEPNDANRYWGYYDALRYAKVLRPFYKDNEEVQKLYEGLMTTKNNYLNRDMALVCLENDIAVDTAILNKLAAYPGTRVSLYTKLKKLKKTELFDTAFYNDHDFTYSLIFSGEYSGEKDSTEFIRLDTIMAKDKQYVVWSFKCKKEDDDNWYLGYGVYTKSDTGDVRTTTSFKDAKDSDIYPDDDMDEIFEEFFERFRVIGRRRAHGGGGEYDYEEVVEEAAYE